MTMIDKTALLSVGTESVRGSPRCLLLAMACLVPGCGWKDRRTPTVAGFACDRKSPAAKAAGPTVTNYTLQGVVRSLAPETGAC